MKAIRHPAEPPSPMNCKVHETCLLFAGEKGGNGCLGFGGHRKMLAASKIFSKCYYCDKLVIFRKNV